MACYNSIDTPQAFEIRPYRPTPLTEGPSVPPLKAVVSNTCGLDTLAFHNMAWAIICRSHTCLTDTDDYEDVSLHNANKT